MKKFKGMMIFVLLSSVTFSASAGNVCDTLYVWRLQQCNSEAFAIAEPACLAAQNICNTCQGLSFGIGLLTCILACGVLEAHCDQKTKQAIAYIHACTNAAGDEYDACIAAQSPQCTS
jgi:hypothetical protein